MPYIDLNSEQYAESIQVPDFTIIGAGAAGIMMAVELSRAGKKVMIIESGHFHLDEEKQKLNEADQSGKTVENVVWGRKRAIGGTTLAWGGQSLPFSSIDFMEREWVENSGWPFAYEEIAPYYNAANNFMKIDSLDYRKDIFKKARIKDPGIDPALLDYHVSKWAKEPDFRKLNAAYLEKNVPVLFNAQLLNINRNTCGNAETITVSNFRKKQFVINIRSLILCSGTIETIRMLLTNDIGNTNGWTGKCFMEHPCIEIGYVDGISEYIFQRYFNTHTWRGSKYSVRLSLADKYQRENKTLGCSASIMFYNKKENAFDRLRDFLKKPAAAKLGRLLKDSGLLIPGILAWLKDSFYFKKSALNKVVLMVEQEPLEESFISLSDKQDSFGVFKALVNWKISEKTWVTIIKASALIQSELNRLKLGEVRLHPNINSLNAAWADDLSDVNHHMGGCRMSCHKDAGVVNSDLQVWEVPNIYICSCAVFPTGSHSNPTLTLLALCAKLKDFLLAQK